jgi:hypothetical protein
MATVAPARAHDRDRLRLPSASASRAGEAEKKNPNRPAAADPASYPTRRHQGAIPPVNFSTMSALPHAHLASPGIILPM